MSTPAPVHHAHATSANDPLDPRTRGAFHRMGLALDIPSGLTGADALRAAGLAGWDLRVLPFSVLDSSTGMIAESSKHGMSTIVRTDPATGAPQIIGGCVSSRYVPIDPEHAFGTMADALLHESLVAEAGGEYGPVPGAYAFMSFRLPESVTIAGDEVYSRLLLHTDNTGRGSFTAFLHRERVACSNVIRKLNGTSSVKWNLQHSARARDLAACVVEARTMLGLVELADKRFEAQVQRMLETEVTNQTFEQIIEAAIGEPPEATSGALFTRYNNRVDQVWDAYNDSSNDGIRGTAWGAYNAFTFWDQHLRTARGGEDVRATRVVFGPADTESKALEALRTVVGV